MTLPAGAQIWSWRPLDPARAGALVDARLQVHHAAQLATALGISYLPAQADDSHTNLEWLPRFEALASNDVRGIVTVRLAVRPHPLALLVLEVPPDGGAPRAPAAVLDLGGRTIADAARWIRGELQRRSLDPIRYTVDRHYTIPDHAVGAGAPFDVSDEYAFEQVATWFANAAGLLTTLASEISNASPVRCWPHHFDIATLLALAPGRTIGAGMEPGDSSYAEPYFYVTASPPPDAAAARPALGGGGSWHTTDWTGAVLPGSRVGRADQRGQCEEFLRSAILATRRLVSAPG